MEVCFASSSDTGIYICDDRIINSGLNNIQLQCILDVLNGCVQLFHHTVTILSANACAASFACCFSSSVRCPVFSACCRIRSSFSIVSRDCSLNVSPVVFPSSPPCRTSQTASAFRTSSTSGIIIVHGCLLISQHEICLSECNRLVIYSNCRFCSVHIVGTAASQSLSSGYRSTQHNAGLLCF